MLDVFSGCETSSNSPSAFRTCESASRCGLLMKAPDAMLAALFGFEGVDAEGGGGGGSGNVAGSEGGIGVCGREKLERLVSRVDA